MIFHPARIPGVFVIDPEPRADERGAFARVYCEREMAAHALNASFVQANVTYNYRKGTIRGLHWQTPPATECKLIRCTSGAIYDVIIDMRPGSPTYLEHFAIELSASNRRMLYIPGQFAAGYQALTDGAEASYLVSEFYTPETERGVRFDDPAFGIIWPLPATEVSDKDRAWPFFGRALEMSA